MICFYITHVAGGTSVINERLFETTVQDLCPSDSNITFDRNIESHDHSGVGSYIQEYNIQKEGSGCYMMDSTENKANIALTMQAYLNCYTIFNLLSIKASAPS